MNSRGFLDTPRWPERHREQLEEFAIVDLSIWKTESALRGAVHEAGGGAEEVVSVTEWTRKDMMAPNAAAKLTEVTVKLPGVDGKWVADEAQQQAAWQMYVELVTRVAVQPLGHEEGLLREALASLHALFGETRRILREHGPSVATAARPGSLSFGQIAVAVLNRVLRPLLAKWHPLLARHEGLRPPDVPLPEHERAWARAGELRSELEAARRHLVTYANLLATVCGVQRLHDLR